MRNLLNLKNFIDQLGNNEDLEKEKQKFKNLKKIFYIILIIFFISILFIISFIFTSLILIFYLNDDNFTNIEYFFSIFSLGISILGIFFGLIGIFFSIYFFNLSWNFQIKQSEKNTEMLEDIKENTYSIFENWEKNRNSQEKEQMSTEEIENNIAAEGKKLDILINKK